MRYFLLLAAVTFPLADIFVTLRLSSWINVPAWVLFSLGMVAGWLVLAEERMSFRTRTLALLSDPQALLPGLLDSGRKVLAGILFILPGIVSDLIGLVLLMMPINLASRLRPQPVSRGSQLFEGNYRRID